MCELYIAKKFGSNTLETETIRNLLESALEGSRTNPDGFGAFNDAGKQVHSEHRFKKKHIDGIVEHFEGSDFFVFHVRMATTGEVTKKNAHPFQNGNILMSHNGVIRGVSSEDGNVDSEQFLNHVMNEQGDFLSEKISNAVRDVGGSFSNFFRTGDDLLYFRKTSSMTFELREDENLLLGATKDRRLDNIPVKSEGFIKKFFKKSDSVRHRKNPEEEVLYRITDEGIEKECDLDIGTDYYSYYPHNLRRTYGSYYGGHRTRTVRGRNTRNRSLSEDDGFDGWVRETGDSHQCRSCGRYFNTKFDVLQHVRDKHGVWLDELEHVAYPT